MHKYELNRVEFYSKEDMAVGHHLSTSEQILRNELKSVYENINDILELYNIKKYLDNDLYLKSWTQNDINEFKQKVIEYVKIAGQFMSKINDNNFIFYHEQLLYGYISTFWELVVNQKIYKHITPENIKAILSNNPNEIEIILTHKKLVKYYDAVLRWFLLTYTQSAEIILSIFEVKDVFNIKMERYLPQSLTIQDKENIVSNYIDSAESNLNYLRLIINVRNKEKFKLSDKTRLKAKRKEKLVKDKIFSENLTATCQEYGVSISFPENIDKIKMAHIEGRVANYSYSLNYIKQNNDYYTLFQNFKILFEYIDGQGRINLVSKKIQMGVLERVMGIHSDNEYNCGIAFNMNEMTSHAQIFSYCRIINGLGVSLENVLQTVFTLNFQEKYHFANNARLSMPSATVSSFEKVRFLAPEFESVLKQFKFFVDDGGIDFELLQMSSTPCAIRDIPSLNQNKYLYVNENNKELNGCLNLIFSDQAMLTYVYPFNEKHYYNLFELLSNEEIQYDHYENFQKSQINYLIDKGFLFLDNNRYVQITNIPRILILKDLYENEVASFYHYEKVFQEEVKQMENQNMVFFESSLLSKPEQSYFNYYLNKSEYTNGYDLRNSYLHGTQANPEEIEIHDHAYFTYLKLLVLVILKIEDDLLISKALKN